jgi:hypothetical protein
MIRKDQTFIILCFKKAKTVLASNPANNLPFLYFTYFQGLILEYTIIINDCQIEFPDFQRF